ncbi:hypothetical protein CEXT_72311 [Caerostris extrusa]|uniref:Uncharacterized protein n=1 Tax=Caerostris extrusa TaxID=172846 RepID=A0AAV4M8W9_CAEEX|nr:hypothetical protein CEXT_72311 [Caerostris extrusa]
MELGRNWIRPSRPPPLDSLDVYPVIGNMFKLQYILMRERDPNRFVSHDVSASAKKRKKERSTPLGTERKRRESNKRGSWVRSRPGDHPRWALFRKSIALRQQPRFGTVLDRGPLALIPSRLPPGASQSSLFFFPLSGSANHKWDSSTFDSTVYHINITHKLRQCLK